MTFLENLRHGQSVNGDSVEDPNEYDPWRLLAAQIVISAVEDWRLLIKEREWELAYPRRGFDFHTLRYFFNSQWCAFLMQNFSTAPNTILQLLEKELEDARNADAAGQAQIKKKYNKNMGRTSRERARQRDYCDSCESKGNK